MNAVTNPPELTTTIILATNIAESSVTFPNVSCVVDTALQKRLRLRGMAGSGSAVSLDTIPVSKKSALQRAGRAGRTCPGTYYSMLTADEHEALPDADCSDLVSLYPIMAVLELMAAGVDPAILEIEPEKHMRIIPDLVELKLVEPTSVPTSPYYVTSLGMAVQKYPVSLELAVVCAWTESRVVGKCFGSSAADLEYRFVVAVLAIVAMMDGSQGGSFFWVPREHRASKEGRDAFVNKHFSKFKGDSDLCTYLIMFDAMHNAGHFSDWAKDNSMNNQLLRGARRTFRQVASIMMPMLPVPCERDIVDCELSSFAASPVLMNRIYKLFGAGFKGNVFATPKRIRSRLTYEDSSGMRYFVDGMRSFSKMSDIVVDAVVAAQVIEVRNDKSVTRYISCLFPRILEHGEKRCEAGLQALERMSAALEATEGMYGWASQE
jgi:HrpA-like RNA helicase